MGVRAVPAHGGGLRAYGPSRLAWVQRLRPSGWCAVVVVTIIAGYGGSVLVAVGRPVVAGVVLALPLSLWALLAAAMIGRPRAVISRRADKQVWVSVEESTSRALGALPALTGLVDVAEAGGVVRRAGWEVACLLEDGARLVAAREEARWAAYGLTAGDPLRAELAARRADLTDQLAGLDGEINRRVATLETMARAATGFARQRARQHRAPKVARRARRAIREADATAAGTRARWQPGADPAAELTERTTAVLAAYRELSTLPADTTTSGLGCGTDGP